MINILAKIISATFCGITITYTTKTVLGQKTTFRDFKTLLLIIVISAITFFSYGIKYNTDSTLMRIVLYIVVIKLIINSSIYKTILSTFISMFILLASDLITSLIFINFTTMPQVRGTWPWFILSNFCVCTIALIIISIPQLKAKLRYFINEINDKGKISTISIFALSVTVIVYTLYNISLNYRWSEKYIINVIVTGTYFVIIIVFLKDRMEFNNLMNKYDNLFDYFNEFEENFDKVSLINHEYKNQLAVIKGYLKSNKEKEAEKYLNNIISDFDEEDQMFISALKNVPKGGIKGLLYYKVITAKNKNVEVVLDVGPHLADNLNKLNYEENKIISKILGVYIDNAIDAAKNSNKKIVSIEIYNLNNEINFVICNKFRKNQLQIGEIAKKGYTTKGKGHGKGLYLINKLIRKYDYFRAERKIINNFYVQKLIISSKTNS